MKNPRNKKMGRRAGIEFNQDATIHGDVIGGNQITNKYYGSKSKKKARPRLEFYTMNRRDQKRELDVIIARYRSEKPLPIIAVIHGDENQAVDTFLERIREDFIPSYLPEISGTKSRPEYFPIRELIQDPYESVEEFQNRLRELLAKMVKSKNSILEIDEIRKRISKSKCPMIIELQLSEGLVLNSNLNVLRTIADFWSGLRLPARQCLFVLVYFRYRAKSESGWGDKFGALFRKDTKLTIKTHLEQLAHETGKLENVIYGVLSELPDVPETDAMLWADTFKDKLGFDIEDFKEVIQTVYKNENEIPLHIIAKALKEQYQKSVPE